ncbi:MAG: YkgJ family cysteine cluster protein [Gammaproteobacteria bacterium]|nr:YkgJ family cysteine cluster protein [Gammaproteobacteria bacterium]
MSKPDFPDIEANAEFDSTQKCDLCTNSTCCTYVTQQIDTPKSKYDFEILLWQVSHKRVGVYKDEDGWFVMFEASCIHLEMDGRCGIYDDRPTICRTHKNDFCEYDAPAEDGFELYFPNYSTLLTYCKKRFKKWTTGNPAPE